MKRYNLIQLLIFIIFLVCLSISASASEVGYKVGLYDEKKVIAESEAGKKEKAESGRYIAAWKMKIRVIVKRIQKDEYFAAIYEIDDPKKSYYSEHPIDLSMRLVDE
jgi:hypothetical protein